MEKLVKDTLLVSDNKEKILSYTCQIPMEFFKDPHLLPPCIEYFAFCIAVKITVLRCHKC